MSQIAKKHLLAGIIFGDVKTSEYIYLPAGEVGSDDPLCVLETTLDRQDITLEEAGSLIDRLSLKPIAHPTLGKKSF